MYGLQSVSRRWGGGQLLLLVWCFFCLDVGFCWSLNDEGLALLKFRQRIVDDPHGALSSWNDNGEVSPCSWTGVECSQGNVVVVNLKDLHLGGTLAPELGDLVHIKAIILRNNSLFGIIPHEIGDLKELEVLDLGFNNFTGSVPQKIGNNPSLAILLLDHNSILNVFTPEVEELNKISECQVDENQLSSTAEESSSRRSLISWSTAETANTVNQRLISIPPFPFIGPSKTPPSPSLSPSVPPSTSPPQSPSAVIAPPLAPSVPPSPSPTQSPSADGPRPPSAPPVPPQPTDPNATGPPPGTRSLESGSRSKTKVALISVAAAAGGLILVISVIGLILWQRKKVRIVKPWATGLSGQLQKAFVTGVPKLKRSDLESACEDFSNVIGSSAIGNVYKGTLSSGEEIAVTSVSVKSVSNWSADLESQFRIMVDTLSKVNHKNFVNLVGYCEEEEPFSRMLVFEYAPNGTLFEHLHIKEAEHLDWRMRLRVAMGVAYCLGHMHQLTAPLTHKNLNSSSINLTEDYAAKISYFTIWNEAASNTADSSSMEISSTSSAANIYSFGVTLFEIITGTLPYSANIGSLDDWALDYLSGLDKPIKETVDPTLKTFDEGQLEAIHTVIKSCVHPDPTRRPTMVEVMETMRQITGLGPDQAIPRISPLWWAELEILSTEGA